MTTALTPEAAPEDSSQNMRVLEAKAVNAAVFSVLEYGCGMGMRVISSLVLTRILLPAYFGEMILVTTLIMGINLLSDVGLGPSVIQSPRGDDPLFLNTAWTVQAFRGLALWIVSILICRPLSAYYHDASLKYLLPVLALSTLLSGFNSTNLLTLARHMGVRRLFAIDGSSSLVSLIVTIAWAYRWPSVWSIVGGQIAGALYRLVLSHTPAAAPGIRNRFAWDKESVHSIVHFGKWIMIGTAFFFFASQADRLILGRLISLTLLGIYGIAYQLSDIPRQVLLALGSRVFYPFIAKIINLPLDDFRRKFLRYRFQVLLAGGGLLSIMVVWGNLLIITLYDPRYRQGNWMIPILAAGLWHTLLYQTTAPVLFSLGKTRYNAIGNAAYCVFIIGAILVGFRLHGILGAVIAVAAGDLPLYVVIQYGATRERIRPLPQDLLLTGIFIAMLASCFAVRFFIPWNRL
jgi:O-antigen/teichoic acid export membrane protein